MQESKTAKQELLLEEILSRQTKEGEDYYLIKWKGVKEKYNSWEKKEDLGKYQEQIERFDKNYSLE